MPQQNLPGKPPSGDGWLALAVVVLVLFLVWGALHG